MSSYKPQHFLKQPSDPIQIDANRVRVSDSVPFSLNRHSEESSQSASSSGSQFAFASDFPNEVVDMEEASESPEPTSHKRGRPATEQTVLELKKEVAKLKRQIK